MADLRPKGVSAWAFGGAGGAFSDDGGPALRLAKQIVRKAWRITGHRPTGPLSWMSPAGEMLVPAEHQLPETMALYPHYSQNLPRLIKLFSGKYPDLSVIDVGANVGDTARFIRAASDAPILCVEGNPQYLAYLHENINGLQGVQVEECFLGDDQSLGFSVVADKGTARLESEESVGAHNEIRTRRLDDVLTERPAFKSAKVLKSDTDGFEGKVLRGSRGLLDRARPVVFIEFDPALLDRQGEDGVAVVRELTDSGYDQALVYDAFGYLMFGIGLEDARVLNGLVSYLRHKMGLPYVDLAVFHSCDSDLFETCISQETLYFDACCRWDG